MNPRARAQRKVPAHRPPVDLDAREPLRLPPLDEHQVDRRQQAGQRPGASRPAAAPKTASWAGPWTATAAAPARRRRSLSLPGTSKPCGWPECLMARHADAPRRRAPATRAHEQRGLARRRSARRRPPPAPAAAARPRVSLSEKPRLHPLPLRHVAGPLRDADERLRQRRPPHLGGVAPDRAAPVRRARATAQRKRARPGPPLAPPRPAAARPRGRTIRAAPASRRSAGRAKTSKATRQADGLPGQAEHRLPAEQGEEERLARLHGDAVHPHVRAQGAERPGHQVLLAHRDAADGDHARRRRRARPPARPRARAAPSSATAPAPTSTPALRRGALPAPRRSSRASAPGPPRRRWRGARPAGAGATSSVLAAHRLEERELARPEPGARRAAPRLPRPRPRPRGRTFSPGRGLVPEEDPVAARLRRLLPHHRVGARGQRRAGEDPRRLPGTDGGPGQVAGVEDLRAPAARPAPERRRDAPRSRPSPSRSNGGAARRARAGRGEERALPPARSGNRSDSSGFDRFDHLASMGLEPVHGRMMPSPAARCPAISATLACVRT